MQSKLTEPARIVNLQIQTIPRGTQPFSGSQPTEPATVFVPRRLFFTALQ
jgi:hypothetical protein